MYATVVYMNAISDHFTAHGNRNTFSQSMKILQISTVFVTVPHNCFFLKTGPW